MSETRRQILTATVAKLRKRIQQIRELNETIGEEDTKAALIDPLLSALGWDIEEIEEVRREYRRKPQDNPVDYALFVLRSPRLFVEAKGLEKDLNDRKWISQNLSYATVVGVEWCALTNGDEYRLYNAHAAVDVEEKLFRDARISDLAQDQFAVDTLELLSKEKVAENSLSTLWKAHSVDRKVNKAVDDLFTNEDKGLIRLIRKKTTGLNPSEIRSSLRRAAFRIDFPLVCGASAASSIPGKAGSAPLSKTTGRSKKSKTLGVELTDLIQAGLVSPPLELERNYKGARLKATIQQNGNVIVDGNAYDSPSTAAGMARKSVIGARPGRAYPQTNGWMFWRYVDSQTGKLRELDLLRQDYLKRNC
jgi:hypothetical protein